MKIVRNLSIEDFYHPSVKYHLDFRENIKYTPMPAPVVWVYSCGSGDDIDFYHETCLQLACLSYLLSLTRMLFRLQNLFTDGVEHYTMCLIHPQGSARHQRQPMWPVDCSPCSGLFSLCFKHKCIKCPLHYTIFSPPLKIYHWIPYKHSYQKAGLCCWLLLLSCDMSFGWQSQYWVGVDLLWDLTCCNPNLSNPLSFDILILLCLGV